MNNITLLILDGWGMAPDWGGNAISQARTPNFDLLWKNNPHTELRASGADVGLTGHEAGNSEVGHLNIGAGRIVYQDSSRITQSIKDGSFYKNKILIEACNHAKNNKSSLHLMGLVSSGNVHSQFEHLFSLLDFAKTQNISKLYIHVFTDGRDSDPQSAIIFISRLLKKIKDVKIGEIASINGRYYAMDRDQHWERTELAYKAIAWGIGETSSSPLSAISNSYTLGVTDEFIKPTIITKSNKPVATVEPNDSIIFFNFRADRARQLTKAFTDSNFDKFKTKVLSNIFFCGFIPYEAEKDGTIKYAFGPQNIKNTLAEVISNHHLSQFHIAETEKYAHVTYFFNGGREKQFPREDRLVIPSLRVATYDTNPEMRVREINKNLITGIRGEKYAFIVANFANADMVGHTGNFRATILSCEAVDNCLGQLVQAIGATHGLLIITADHGNAEEVLNPKTGEIDTEHSHNNVPLIFVDKRQNHCQYLLRSDGILADIAPTILDLLKIASPSEMTGKSLIVNRPKESDDLG